MDTLILWLWEHIEKVVSIAGLLFIAIGLVVALYRSWLYTGKEVDRLVAQHARELQHVQDDCKFQREQNERLLDKIERLTNVTEVVVKRAGNTRNNG